LIQLTDQIGRRVEYKEQPTAIVSLVPSLTSLLSHLNLSNSVKGITRYCIHPPHWIQEKTVVGGTKKTIPKRIENIQPDLLLLSKEENVPSDVAPYLEQYPCYVSDVVDYSSAIQMIIDVGQITNRTREAKNLVQQIELAFCDGEKTDRGTAAYFIWKNPWMVAGGDTFISEMMSAAGLKNVFAQQSRYPMVNWEEIEEKCPDYLLLSSEPYSFTEQDCIEIRAKLKCTTKVLLVDGIYFSWYGNFMAKMPGYWNDLFKNNG